MTNGVLDKWDARFIELAKFYSGFSKDPSRKIGAVAVNPVKRIILSSGYNGFPRGIADTPERLNDREVKYSLMTHGEMNCIYNATFNGVSLDGATMYVHGLPVCSECAKGIIQVGIRRVVVNTDEYISELWSSSWKRTVVMFDEAGVDWNSNFDILN